MRYINTLGSRIGKVLYGRISQYELMARSMTSIVDIAKYQLTAFTAFEHFAAVERIAADDHLAGVVRIEADIIDVAYFLIIEITDLHKIILPGIAQVIAFIPGRMRP
jgi:hypothetical protein